ncbi:MAG: phosphotransferase family protein [Cumulibacter sp.]
MAQDELVGIEENKVRAWLSDNIDGLQAPVNFSLVSGGRSNLTYGVTDAAGKRYALRRPPTGGVLSTAHDVKREWQFISALKSSAVPVPPPVAYCDDASVTGADFYVMEFVDGRVLADAEEGARLEPEARRRAAEQTIDVMVALHDIDPAAAGLGELIRNTGFVERQLRRWKRQLEANGVDDPLMNEVHDLLAAHIPAQGNGIVHGDFRPGNISYAPDGTAVAVFDWELATTGDPLADLSWMMASWQEPGEDGTFTTPGPSSVEGYLTRKELIERYASRSGRDVSNLPYWIGFAKWRSACIGVGVRARYAAGVMADDGYAEQISKARASTDALAESARAALRQVGI